MNPDDGTLYPSLAEALTAGVQSPVELVGSPAQVARVALAVQTFSAREREARRRKSRMARASRRMNR